MRRRLRVVCMRSSIPAAAVERRGGGCGVDRRSSAVETAYNGHRSDAQREPSEREQSMHGLDDFFQSFNDDQPKLVSRSHARKRLSKCHPDTMRRLEADQLLTPIT